MCSPEVVLGALGVLQTVLLAQIASRSRLRRRTDRRLGGPAEPNM